MDSTIVYTLVGMVGISAILMILVQLGKDLLPTTEDAGGMEVGPRRWLAPAVLVIGTLLGLLVGAVRGDYKLPDGAAYMMAWAIVGFVIGASSTGLYSGLKSLLPGVFSDSGWIGRNRG